LGKSYIAEYIPVKVAINKEVEYNEVNIIGIIANIEDYNKFINEFERTKQEYNKKQNSLNKSFEKMLQDNQQRIEHLNKSNMPNSFFKTDLKQSPNSSFDDIIKSKAEEIISKVNQITEMNERKKKK